MKSFTIVLFVLQLLLSFTASAQINDCVDAQVVCNDEDLSFNPDGPGLDDFEDPDNDPGCITALEQNSAWYYFEIDPNAPPGLILGFIIHPKGGLGEDYDWALFGPDVDCGNLGSPIRCSSSSAACGFCPETGMGMGTTDFTEGPGTGDGFVMTLEVEPGQGFYLLIDNWAGTTNGFTLTWTDSAAPYLNCSASPPCALSADAGPDINACEGDPDIPINGSSTGNHGNETYSWSGSNGGTDYLNDPNIANPILSLPGGFFGSVTYTLTVVEDTCISEDEFELTVNPLPIININQIGPFCQNDAPVTLTATPPGGVWGGDATGSTFNPMTSGPGTHSITYTYTDGNTCTAMESIDVDVYANPDVSIGPDPAEFCDSEGAVLLTATGSGGGGDYFYFWNTPTGTAGGDTYSATAPGLHTVAVTDVNGCTNTSAITVITHANPLVEINDPGLICESLEFLTITAIPGGGIFSGDYISPTGDLNPNTIDPGTYSISYNYVDGNNCEGSATLNYTIIPVPNAYAENNGPLCEGQPILLFGETDGSGSMISYFWSGPNGYTSTSANPTNATLGGFYNLVVTIDGCPSSPAVTEVFLTPMPDAAASNGGPYCNGQSIQLLGSTSASGNIISYQWSGPNGYSSSVQNPTDATEAGTYSLIITVDNCASAITQTDVIFNAPPDALATNNGPYCAGETIELLGNTSTPGNIITYTWSGPNGYVSNLQNPIDALQPGLYQLIVSVDGCNSTTSATDVLIHSLPQPMITGEDSFCTGFSATIDAGAGYVAYVWNDASINQTLEVTTSGIYTVTVTDANGCNGQASLAVTENTSLSPVITGTLAFCEGSGTSLDAGTGFSNYQWSTGETTQSIQVTSGGNFGVIVTDADGCTGSANITTTVNANPIVTIGGSTTYCIGGFTVLDAGAGYINYSWSNSATSQTITVASPGIYAVDVVDINGCAGSTSVAITESTSLSPVITGNDAFCENGSTTLNAGSGFATYLWSDGSGNQMLVVNTSGNYSVTVSDNQGCSGETSISISEVLPPSAVVQATTQLCNTTAGGSVINLYSLVLSGDMNGSWADADNSGAAGLFTNLNFNGVPAGNYRFIYTTNSAIFPCPEVTYQVVVTVLDCTCPDVLFFNAGPLCNTGDILDLATLENTAESGIWTILQTPPGSNPALLNGSMFNTTSGDPGQYVFQFSLLTPPPPGCPSDYQVTVHVDQAVDAGIALQPVSYCSNDNVSISLAGLITGADANGTWKETSSAPSQGSAFNAVNGTFVTNNQLSGTYTFEYTLASNGACPGDATVVSVIINPLPIALIADFGILNCINTTQSLDAEGSSFGPEYDITWTGPGVLLDGNENTLHPTIDEPGNYILTITNTLTGCTNAAAVNVIQNIDSPSDAVIVSQDPSCFGDQDASISINQVMGGTPPYLFSLNTGPFSSTNTFQNLSPGSYDIVLEDANGCRWDTMITLLEPSEISLDLGDDIELDLGESAMIQAAILPASIQLDTLIWSPFNIIECFDLECLEGIVHTFNSITLHATVFDENGCQASDNLSITVRKNRKVYIPTAFSPNDDGINDIFYIMGDEGQIVKIKNFRIFNRWGEAIFEVLDFYPNDPQKGWDGHFKNEILNPGVFVYAAEVEFIDGLVQVYTGDVTLMK